MLGEIVTLCHVWQSEYSFIDNNADMIVHCTNCDSNDNHGIVLSFMIVLSFKSEIE